MDLLAVEKQRWYTVLYIHSRCSRPTRVHPPSLLLTVLVTKITNVAMSKSKPLPYRLERLSSGGLAFPPEIEDILPIEAVTRGLFEL